jgi:hypothetical protein
LLLGRGIFFFLVYLFLSNSDIYISKEKRE